ncbi:TonB-dependent receptor [Flagellimonas flava]|uniref:TonB-dependent Receptor Plug Domain n=1 Tax=Flagellimonas flava TaxID=570519 RepID=A0A1M5I0H7_9FLAO|nr:TonB-dependent receptor [Allomuricauda flava]SHG21836.1 TonB-dependent Receptor Plug Domain [Allomuricauda flava]
MKSLMSTCFLFCVFWGVSQTSGGRITVTFENWTLKELASHIQETTDYHFFYVDQWLVQDTISGSFSNTPLENVLKEVLGNTDINYFLMDRYKVILTRGNTIYDTLPEGFFTSSKTDSAIAEIPEIPDALPIFNKNDVAPNREGEVPVKIGREKRDRSQQFATLEGFAVNAGTNEPISDLAVLVQRTGKGTTTNANGYYSIEIPLGSHTIEVSALGIQGRQQKIILYGNGRLNFELEESFQMLDEVVLQGNSDRNINQTIGGAVQIEMKEIKKIPLVLGERDIFKVATTLPGISSAGEGATGYNVRGGRTDQNLILLDHAVIYNPTHFFGLFSAINPFTSDNVEVFKGNIPAEFGGRLSSVFDIRTKTANDKKLSGEASIGPVTGNLALEIPIAKDKASLLVGGRTTYSKWILRSLKEEELRNNQVSFFDVVAKYNHKINQSNTLRLMGYYSDDAFNITRDSLYGYTNRAVSLEWAHKFNDKNTGELILANSGYDFDIEFDVNSVNDFKLAYSINETLLKLKMKYLHNDAHNIDYGISGKLYNVEPGSIDPLNSETVIESVFIPDERGIETAFFLSDDIAVNQKLSLNAGLRYSLFAALGESSQRIYENGSPRNENTLIETQIFDENEVIKTYGGLETRVSARYFVAPNTSLKLGYNSSFQYVHTLSNNTTVSPTDTWKLSDINIKPQRADQFALGLHKNINENAFELSLETYYKKFDNILDYKTGADLLLNETVETEVLQGKGKSYGIEFLAKKNNGKLNGWLGYTYSRSLIKFDGLLEEERINNGEFFPSNFDKPHDLSLVTNYKFSKRFSLSANFVYQTGRPVTYPVGNYVYEGQEYTFYTDRNKFRIPDYYRLDLSFNVEGNHKIKKFAHSFWNISIYNVLGRNNPYSVFFVTENGQIKAYKSSIFAIPIPTITYNFKF